MDKSFSQLEHIKRGKVDYFVVEIEFHPHRVQQQDSPGYHLVGCSLQNGECSRIPSNQQVSFWTPCCPIGSMLRQQHVWHDVTAATPLLLSRNFSGTEIYVKICRFCSCFCCIANLLLQVHNGQATMLDPSFWVRHEVPQHRRKINHIPTMKFTNPIIPMKVPTISINPPPFQSELTSSNTSSYPCHRFTTVSALIDIVRSNFHRPEYAHRKLISVSSTHHRFSFH